MLSQVTIVKIMDSGERGMNPVAMIIINLQGSTDCLNGVLRHLQHYFAHITATAHIIHVFPGFQQYKAWALKCLAQGHSQENPEPGIEQFGSV